MHTISNILGFFGAVSTAQAAPLHVEASLSTLATSDQARLVMTALLAILALTGLWSSVSRVGVLALRGPVARNLFLGVRVATTGAEFGAHLLAICPRSATIVSPKPLPRGAPVTLDFGGLLEFAEGTSPAASRLHAEVISDRRLHEPKDTTETHVLVVRFSHLSPAEERPLRQVIAQLARDGRVAQA